MSSIGDYQFLLGVIYAYELRMRSTTKAWDRLGHICMFCKGRLKRLTSRCECMQDEIASKLTRVLESLERLNLKHDTLPLRVKRQVQRLRCPPRQPFSRHASQAPKLMWCETREGACRFW